MKREILGLPPFGIPPFASSPVPKVQKTQLAKVERNMSLELAEVLLALMSQRAQDGQRVGEASHPNSVLTVPKG